MDPKLGETLISRDAIAQRVAELGAEIDAAYAGAPQPLVLLSVLKGSFIFAADLSRTITIPTEQEFIAVRSYGDGTESSGRVELVKDVGSSMNDRDVLIVEDIIDTGLTTHFLHNHIALHKPRSLKLVSLLRKRGREIKQVHIDFCGFEIDNHFVVGYGLDLAGIYRGLPEIRLVNEEAL